MAGHIRRKRANELSVANDAGSRVLKRRPSPPALPHSRGSEPDPVRLVHHRLLLLLRLHSSNIVFHRRIANPDIIQPRFSKIIAASTNKIGVGTRENSWRLGEARWLPRTFLEKRESRKHSSFLLHEHSNTWKEVCYAPVCGNWCLAVEKLRKNIAQKRGTIIRDIWKRWK